ncbi:MAG TPA: hypothetical protein VGL54_10640 [Solirubrobacteraceae bacterium]
MPKNEVQELTAASTERTIVKVEGVRVACLAPVALNCVLTPPYSGTATALNLQTALEAPYGAGKVTVEESPSSSGRFLITTVGAVAPITVEGTDAGDTVLVRGGSGQLVLTVTNLGDAPASGAATPITITDTLPEGISTTHAEAFVGAEGVASACSTASGSTVTCSFAGELPSYEAIEVRIEASVTASPPVTGAPGQVTVSGGNAASASASQSVKISEVPRPFGVESYSLQAEEEGGEPTRQAGAHPFQLTTTVPLNQGPVLPPNPEEGGRVFIEPPALPRNFRFKLPAGLIGNPSVVPQCEFNQFATGREKEGFLDECPPESAIGVASVTIQEPNVIGLRRIAVPVFNLPPERGEPARFGFFVLHVPVIIDTGVRTGDDYGVTVSVSNTPETAQLLASTITFWGVPGDPRHDSSRGWNCVYHGSESLGACTSPEGLPDTAFLRMPTSCGQSLVFPAELEPWNVPLESEIIDSSFTSNSLSGCNRVPFEPSISAAPDVSDGSTPSGLTVHVHVPQEASLNPAGIGEADVKDTTVTLPEGVQLSPAGANNLEACTEQEIGYQGVVDGEQHFTPTIGEPFCPDGSKVATVEIKTPLLPNPLTGSVYLAAQEENPFGSLVALYLVAEDPISGVVVKLAGKVVPNPVTGQLVTTFEDTPQLPFEELILGFFGGERAPLSTPAHCGTYTTQAAFTPWSGNGTVDSTSSFAVTSGPNGSPCPGASLPFAPSLTTGMSNIQAGGFSPFTMTMSREDGNQNLKSIQLRMPPGLSGVLTGVPLCGEAQADAGTCPAASLIGETVVSVGLGGDPYTVTGGKVYLTGPYEGAPFGLSIVNPADAGPFHLGNVIVRARIEIDPHTAALTVTSDASGPYAIPPMIDGIPLQIKHINVTIDRPGFTFNPTNCAKMAITGALDSIEGASSALSVAFQATNCAALKFTPKFSVTTSGKTSKADGASLTATVSEPAGSMGTQANLTKVKVELPKQLPSRLTTLQKACTNAQFEANPAGCPAESKIGYAVVHTPLVPVPLEGPAIFVSHGGEAFPSLTMVLQGYGVAIDLVGTTFISKSGVTSTTFKTVPDQPFSSFQLTLPEGKFSALAANGNLCKSKLTMPTEFVGQNGAEIHETTPVTAEGCSNALSFISHKIKKRTLTVSVYAPAAGKLTIGGKGLKSVSKTAKQRGAITFKVKQKKAGRLKTTVKVTFTPSTGKDRKKQVKSAKLRFKR